MTEFNLMHTNKHFENVILDSYLNGYVVDENKKPLTFDYLDEAINEALKYKSCGGITYENKKKYTLRKSSKIIKSSVLNYIGARASWLKKEDAPIIERELIESDINYVFEECGDNIYAYKRLDTGISKIRIKMTPIYGMYYINESQEIIVDKDFNGQFHLSIDEEGIFDNDKNDYLQNIKN